MAGIGGTAIFACTTRTGIFDAVAGCSRFSPWSGSALAVTLPPSLSCEAIKERKMTREPNDLLPEYGFDSAKARPNRFAASSCKCRQAVPVKVRVKAPENIVRFHPCLDRHGSPTA